VLTGQSGWGRYLHFLSAWVCVLTGVVYWAYGFSSRHFRNDLLGASAIYNTLQRLTYSVVVFVFFPLMIWTGLAMSPAVTSVFPVLVTAFGGQQSARTIHFAASAALVIFLLGHVTMVCISGFRERMGGMVTGHA
jgi:thiosulfate reductase cytochrome b subunit